MPFRNRKAVTLTLTAAALLAGSVGLSSASAQQAKRPFTVADDIGMTHFARAYGGASVGFSPDGKYFAVYTERGRLDQNVVEDSLSFYRSEEAKAFLGAGEGAVPPKPFWVITRTVKEAENASGEDGAIRLWRWLPDSEGVAFLAPAKDEAWQLLWADIRNKKVEPLTPETSSVRAFDMRDRAHYAYTAVENASRDKSSDQQAPAKVAAGHSFGELFFPDDPLLKRRGGKAYLWAVVAGKRLQVKSNGQPIVPQPNQGFALSPDGNSLATAVDLPVPASWEKLYPPPFPTDLSDIHAGGKVLQFVRIDLRTGLVQRLANAPISSAGGEWEDIDSGAEWSRDGQAVLLPGTYLEQGSDKPSRPCIAVVNVATGTHSCVEPLKGHTEKGVEEGFHNLRSVEFVDGKEDDVLATYVNNDSSIAKIMRYARIGDGWKAADLGKENTEAWRNGFELTIKEGLNNPPVLVAASKEASRVIWDPNPQLKSLEWSPVTIYHWKDNEGREMDGALYKPAGFKPGQRYPLVIQTHGFYGDRFMPSGTFTTAFAAEELASAGIAVLQLSERCIVGGLTPNEGPCAVSVYETAVRQLAADGLVDPEKVGVIGFSRTCFYVMEALTLKSTLRLRAASVNDGMMVDYFQFILGPGGDFNAMIGGEPFDSGLQQWLERSPSFNLDKVNAPLLIMTSNGGYYVGGLYMWGPYAGLSYLKKPADLILLNSNEHEITNPAERVVSQGTNVDWFRFWLQGYEDPDPAKAEQYKRWRGLRQLQAANEKKEASSQVSSK
ncbi:MAG TPA: hypothetical protein VE778_05015 [Candidatus Bathyarchaeia archaeon]|nr:hypothetical protein [Candidatus Bathyarchaeia archaeon]